MSKVIQLMRYTRSWYCLLDLDSGRRKNCKFDHFIDGFTGWYYQFDTDFLALYPVEEGINLYFNGNIFPLVPTMVITYEKSGDERIFRILDYNIEIRYNRFIYGWGYWVSDESDVDICLRIFKEYKNKEFYHIESRQCWYDLQKEFDMLEAPTEDFVVEEYFKDQV